MVYAVATQDAVLVYDTQQTTPLCVVSNLHYATFTDLTWYVVDTDNAFPGLLTLYEKVSRWVDLAHDLQ